MHGGQRISGAVSKAGSAGGLGPLSPVNACNQINVTLLVIPAWIHAGLSCPAAFGRMQICSRQICAGIQKPGIARLIHPCNLAQAFPVGATLWLFFRNAQ